MWRLCRSNIVRDMCRFQTMNRNSVSPGTDLEEERMRIILEDSVMALIGGGLWSMGWQGTNENERGMEEGRCVWMWRGGR